MARRQVVQLEDDIDGGEASVTVRFGVEGLDYEIDLSQENADALRSAFGTYVRSARNVGRGRGARTARPAFEGVDTSAVRAWAAANGIAVNSRGRIPATVVAQYRRAGY